MLRVWFSIMIALCEIQQLLLQFLNAKLAFFSINTLKRFCLVNEPTVKTQQTGEFFRILERRGK